MCCCIFFSFIETSFEFYPKFRAYVDDKDVATIFVNRQTTCLVDAIKWQFKATTSCIAQMFSNESDAAAAAKTKPKPAKTIALPARSSSVAVLVSGSRRLKCRMWANNNDSRGHYHVHIARFLQWEFPLQLQRPPVLLMMPANRSKRESTLRNGRHWWLTDRRWQSNCGFKHSKL